jgi:hypothetical protein
MGIHEGGRGGEALMLSRDSTLTVIFETTPAVDWR